jgi:hypothetical protein
VITRTGSWQQITAAADREGDEKRGKEMKDATAAAAPTN